MDKNFRRCCAGYEIYADTDADAMCYGRARVLEFSLSLPRMRTLGAGVDYLAFNAFYANMGAQLRNEARLELYPAAAKRYAENSDDFTPCSLTVECEIPLISERLACVLIRRKSECGVGCLSCSAQSWLVCEGRRLKLAELFLPDCCPQKLLRGQWLPDADFYLTPSSLVLVGCDCRRSEIPLCRLRGCLNAGLLPGGRP